MLDGYIAYFGTYSVDEKAAHGDASSPAQRAAGRQGRPRARLRICGDRLILRPAGTNAEVVWERIK